MNHELRFGVITLQNVPWKREVERWKHIESLGFDSAWLADHFVDPTRPSSPWFEAWTLLAALATHTTRIRMGTLVTCTAWRNPAFLARQALTVDHLSNGRLELGLGAGARGAIDPSYAMTGTDDWAPQERVDRFREVVEIVDQLLSNPVSSYEGRYYELKDTAMSPAPVQKPRPPLTIGALGPEMLKITARYADTWNSFGGMGLSAEEMLEATRERNAFLDEYCAKIGRDPGTLRRSLLLYDAPAETAYSSMDGFREVFDQYTDAGITEFIINYPFTERHIPIFENIAREIIPELRDDAG